MHPHLVDTNKKQICVKILNGGVFFMAKKGQKFNKYDSTLKYEICKKHFEEGYTEG